VDSLASPEVRPYLSGTPLSSTANSHVTIPYPLKIHPRFKNEYFVPKQSFNIMGMLQNPMMMMMGVVGVMVVAMPYMMVRGSLRTLRAFLTSVSCRKTWILNS
jgi:ER membrane protein complex subunit 7